MYALLLLLLAGDADKGDALAARIDELTTKHRQTTGVVASDPCDDATFLRRVTLDLNGRIPTMAEAKAFAADPAADKRAKTIKRLMQRPEYSMHLGRILDDIVQDRYAGEPAFLEYMRRSVASKRPWDVIFRDVMLGPYTEPERKGASEFLGKRVKSIDELTTDTSRAFFGVNVSCAQCHDHPHVPDWKQDHYFGMASFFNRTAGKPGAKGAPATLEEKTSGEVTFNTTKGERKTAKMMFLTSKVIDEAEAKKDVKGVFSRREQLVKIALEEKNFLSKAIVNQLWAQFMGRGLVHPVDQLHSANAPAIPGVLEALADDLSANRYDLDRIVAALVSSKVYQLSSKLPKNGKAPGEREFAQAPLRPLTPTQLGVSLVLATGEMDLDRAVTAKEQETLARTLEREGERLSKTKMLDPRSDRYQTSTGETLFMTNHPEVQRLVEPTKGNLVARLVAMNDVGTIVDTAVWTVLSRSPEPQERDHLTKWIESRPDRAKGCRQLVWALMSSAEFRFNH